MGMLISAEKCLLKRHAKFGKTTDDQPFEESCCDVVVKAKLGPFITGTMPAGPESVASVAEFAPPVWTGVACPCSSAVERPRNSRGDKRRLNKAECSTDEY